jgi:hypothetical protein
VGAFENKLSLSVEKVLSVLKNDCDDQENIVSGLANHDPCLERFDVAEVFPNDTPDLFCSLFRILVEEDLDDMAFLRLER